jgi:hypothetical protein
MRSESSRLRRFSLVVGGGLTLVGLISWYRGHDTVPLVLWSLAGALVLAGLVYPRSLGPVEKGWMTFGHALGWVNTRIILTALFVLVVVPVGLVMRLFRDPLDRKMRDGRSSYWIARGQAPSPQSYERQF